MHVLIAALWGALVWAGLVAAAFAGAGPSLLLVLVAAPFIVSGVTIALIAASVLLGAVRWLWRCRGTLRLRRSP